MLWDNCLKGDSEIENCEGDDGVEGEVLVGYGDEKLLD
jgi:hypothetical protein